MRENWFTVAVVALVCVGLLGFLFVYQVRENEVAVYERFGKVVRVVRPKFAAPGGAAAEPFPYEGVDLVEHAGCFFRLPWPFAQVHKFDQRIRYIDATQAETLLSDQYPVIPRIYATWRITDPIAIQKNLRGVEEAAADSLRSTVEDAVGVVFGQRHLGDLVNTDPDKLKFDEVEQEILSRVQDSLAAKQYGLSVYTLGITWVALPSGTTNAVFDRMRAERENVATRYHAEGKTQKELIISDAQVLKAKMITDAQQVAKQRLAEAQLKAVKSYEAFAQAPELAIYLRRLDAFKAIAKAASQIGQPLTFVLTNASEPFRALQAESLDVGQVGPGGGPAVPAPVESIGSSEAGPVGAAIGRAEQ